MKNSNEAIGNQNRGLPACSAVPRPSTPPLSRSPHHASTLRGDGSKRKVLWPVLRYTQHLPGVAEYESLFRPKCSFSIFWTTFTKLKTWVGLLYTPRPFVPDGRRKSKFLSPDKHHLLNHSSIQLDIKFHLFVNYATRWQWEVTNVPAALLNGKRGVWTGYVRLANVPTRNHLSAVECALRQQ